MYPFACSTLHDWPTNPRFARYADYRRTRPEYITVPDASAICYHESSRNLIVATRELAQDPDGGSPALHVFSPCRAGRADAPGTVPWEIGTDMSRPREYRALEGSSRCSLC